MNSLVTAEVSGTSEVDVRIKTDEETAEVAAEGREGQSNSGGEDRCSD